MCLLRRLAAIEAGRGRDGNAGGGSAPLQGDRDGACRDCDAISQAPAPFDATPRGFIGPQLLATIMFDQFGQHIPLNRQSTRFKCEGIDLSTRTLPDQVGHVTFAAKRSST